MYPICASLELRSGARVTPPAPQYVCAQAYRLADSRYGKVEHVYTRLSGQRIDLVFFVHAIDSVGAAQAACSLCERLVTVIPSFAGWRLQRAGELNP